MNEKFKTLFSNTLIFAIGNIGSKFIIFFLVPLYTKVLTTEQYGIVELATTAANLIIPFLSLSIQDSVFRYTMDKTKEKGEVLKNGLIVITFSAFLLISLMPFIKLYDVFSNWALYFTLITVVMMYRGVLSLYLKASGKTKLFAVDSIVYTLNLALSNMVFLLIFRLGISGYFLAIIISTVVSILFLIISSNVLSDIKKSRFNTILLKEMLKYSSPLMINAISWWIMSSSDRFMIEYFYSASEVGIYSIAIKFPTILISIVSIFNQAWAISSINEYESTKDKTFYAKTFSLYSFNLIMFSAILIPLVEPFIKVYVSGDFIEAWKYVPFLIIGAIFQSFSSFFGTIYSSAKKNINTMTSSLLSAILNIVLNFLLIPRLGVIGAVIATMVAFIGVGLFRLYDTRRFFSFEIKFNSLYSSVLLLIIQSYIILFLRQIYFVSFLAIIIIIMLNHKEFFVVLNFIKKVLLRKRKK